MKRILNLVLVVVLCLLPVNVFAEGMNGANNEGIDISGKLIKIQNTYTAEDEWFIEDYEGNQHKVLGYLPAMTDAFNSYLGLNIAVSGSYSKDGSSSIIVKQIDCTRYIGSVEKVLIGKLAYKYDGKTNAFKYSLTSIYDNSKYELKDWNNVLAPSLAGKTIVVGGSIYPNPYFSVDKTY